MGEASGQMTFAHALWRNVRERPGAVALVAPGAELTYGQVGTRVAAMAADLAGRGIERGDRIGLVAPNRLDAVLLMVAAAASGITVAPANWRLPAEAAAEYLARLSPTAVFCSAEHRAVGFAQAGPEARIGHLVCTHH